MEITETQKEMNEQNPIKPPGLFTIVGYEFAYTPKGLGLVITE